VVIAFLLSRFTRYIVGRSLVVAAGAYVGFVGAGASRHWFVAEVVHVVIGTIGLLSLRGSPY
jgi:hypothetical protein